MSNIALGSCGQGVCVTRVEKPVIMGMCYVSGIAIERIYIRDRAFIDVQVPATAVGREISGARERERDT